MSDVDELSDISEPLLVIEKEKDVKKIRKTNLSLTPDQESLLTLIRCGSLNDIKNFIFSRPALFTNFVDSEGNNLLYLSVKRIDDPCITLFLLENGIKYYSDFLLYTIKYGDIHVLNVVLKYIECKNPGFEFQPCTIYLEFAPGVSPLMLACHLNNFDVIKLLVDRRHHIEKPHEYRCRCSKCKVIDELRMDLSMQRYNTYKAITNEIYICLTSVDPILEAFTLSGVLSDNAALEPELKVEYENLDDKVRSLAVELLSHCLNSEESRSILNEQYGARKIGEKVRERFTRVAIAMYMDQKEFIAHSITQRLLRQEWLGEWMSGTTLSTFTYMLCWAIKILTFPLIITSYCLLPNIKFSRQLKSPVNKFVSHVVSYILFLATLFFHSEFSENSNKHGPPNTGLEIFIVIWVFGLTWLLIKTFIFQGVSKFFALWWNWYDLINLVAFYTTFAFWIISYKDLIKTRHDKVERKYWPGNDPTLVAEGIFAIAKVLAFGKLLNIFQINQYLGPLQVSLGKMAYDIIVFLVVFSLILLSFGTGLNHFYYYYDNMIKIDADGLKKYQISSFTTLSHTFKTLFWALFGMSPIESADVILSNYDNDQKSMIKGVQEEHAFTQVIGYGLFAGFHCLAIIIFLNIMIAMMSNSFQKVQVCFGACAQKIYSQDNADVEWKFARARVWMSYFEDGRTLPPPFNLIPTTKSLRKFFSGEMFKKKKSKEEHIFEEKYQKLLAVIIERYLKTKYSVPQTYNSLKQREPNLNSKNNRISYPSTNENSISSMSSGLVLNTSSSELLQK